MSGSATRAVLEAFAAGETSLSGVAARTGLPVDLVPVVVDELVRMGMIEREVLGTGCPASQGCGGCASAGPAGDACGTAAPRGPVLLRLRIRR